MSHRIGECSACGAVFKLPASFAHDQARCTKCGGVTEFKDSLLVAQLEKISEQHSFGLENHSLYLYGRCKACAE